MRVIHAKKAYCSKLVLLISLTLGLFMMGANADSHSDNDTSSRAKLPNTYSDLRQLIRWAHLAVVVVGLPLPLLVVTLFAFDRTY